MRHQNAAHFRGASEADVAHDGAGAKHLANRNRVVAVRRQHVQHTCGNTGADGQLRHGQGGQRCQFCGFNNHGTARRQRWRDFAGNHGDREVPGCDGRTHANRLLHHHQAAVVVKLGQHFAVDAFGLFGKPFHKTCPVGDFAFGFGIGFALL